MRLTGGRKLLKGEFFSLFGRAWRRASTVQTAQAGFRGTGMYPVNPMAIHPNVYEPSLTTERPLEPEGSAQEHENLDLPEMPDRFGAEVAVGEDATNTGQEEVLEGVSFATLIPIPKRERGKMRKRSKPPSYHLTSDEHFSYIASKKQTKPTKKKTKNQKQERWRVQARMARTFAIFVKPNLVMQMIQRRQRTGSCALFARTGSMRRVARRMASLKTGRRSLALAVLTCRLTYHTEIKLSLCAIN